MDPSPNPNDPLPLPAEITTEIFKHAISVDFDTLSPKTATDSLTTPLTLATVCQTWRMFVQSVPTLWSVIVLSLSTKRHSAQLSILDLWLTNSGSVPLQIWFSSKDQYSYWEDNPPLDVIQLLVDHSDRWERIDFGIFGGENWKFVDVLQKIKGRIPLLRAGHLRPLEDAYVSRKKFDMFSEAPRLQSFGISVFYLDDVTLPWKKLTTFRGQLGLNECLTILIRCINIEECVFNQIFKESNEEVGPSIDLSHLRSLSITNTDESMIDIIIRRITCPVLCHLQLTAAVRLGPSEDRTDFPFSEIENLITRSRCAMQSLDLECHSIPFSDQVIRILEATPKLRKLTLKSVTRPHSYNFFDGFLGRLDLSTHPPFLPNLTHLRYTNPSYMSELVSLRLKKVWKQRRSPPDGYLKFIELVIVVTNSNRSQNGVAVTYKFSELDDDRMQTTYPD